MATHKQSNYEFLRRRCAELKQLGWKQVDIAKALGLTPGWVSRTIKKYNEGGFDGLVWRKPKGPNTKLSQEQIQQLINELEKGTSFHGFPEGSWTQPRIKQVIETIFGISYDKSQIGRLLKRTRYTLKKLI